MSDSRSGGLASGHAALRVATPRPRARMATDSLRATVATALTAVLVSVASATEKLSSDWPETVVTIAQLRPLAAFRLEVPAFVARGAVRGPASLRAHVDAAGRVVKVDLLESCGNPDLDTAAIQAMRAMAFAPYTAENGATDVSLVVPVHVPKRFGRSR